MISCKNERVFSFERDTFSLVRDTFSFKRDDVSFKQDNFSFDRDKFSLERDKKEQFHLNVALNRLHISGPSLSIETKVHQALEGARILNV